MRSPYYPFIEERSMLAVIDDAVVGAGCKHVSNPERFCEPHFNDPHNRFFQAATWTPHGKNGATLPVVQRLNAWRPRQQHQQTRRTPRWGCCLPWATTMLQACMAARRPTQADISVLTSGSFTSSRSTSTCTTETTHAVRPLLHTPPPLNAACYGLAACLTACVGWISCI